MGNLASAPKFGAGRPPADDRSKVRNRHEIKGWLDVVDTPFLAGRKYELPPGEWTERTIAWWDNVRTMPHAILWAATDWDYAVDTAYVHNMMWSGVSTAATELRQRERLMGITWESRRAASIRYIAADGTVLPQETTGGEATVPPPTPMRKPRLRAIDPAAR